MFRSVWTKLVLAAGLSCALALPIAAQQPGEELQGVITHVELSGSPRVIRVDVPGRGQIEVNIANRTRVVAKNGVGGLGANPELSDLQPGMTVRFKYDRNNVERIHVVDAPPGMRPRGEDKAPTAGQDQQLKVRILSTNSRDEIVADVAGRRQVFRVRESGLLRGFRTGDLVVLTVDGAGMVTDVRSAAQSGRVVRVGRRDLVIEVDGREETFGIDDNDVLKGVRVGQTVRFDVEERAGGRRVITRVY
jgi:Cu/Ag efflux protein CusF